MTAQKVALLYGIGEGDYHGRAFTASLKKAGYTLVRDARKADIIVTHSGAFTHHQKQTRSVPFTRCRQIIRAETRRTDTFHDRSRTA